MSLATKLAHLMTQQVTIAPFSGLDAYGQSTWGSAAAYQARVQQQAKLVMNVEGQQVTSMTQVFLAVPVLVSARDRITLPSPLIPATPPILAVSQSPDLDGTLITTVFC